MVPVRRLGDARAVRGRHPRAPGRARRTAGVFDVSHMGELQVEGPTAQRVPPGAALERPRPDRGRRGAVHAADERARRDRRRPDRLPARATVSFLLVVNASNREADFALAEGARDRAAREVRDVSDDYALLAVQGPRALERLGLARGAGVHVRDGRDRRHRGAWSTAPATRASRASSCCCSAEDAVALWDAVLARGVTPCGLGARDTLRLEVCYPLHGNDITPGDGRDLRRPRLGVRARQGVHRRRRAAPDQGGGPGAEARRRS